MRGTYRQGGHGGGEAGHVPGLLGEAQGRRYAREGGGGMCQVCWERRKADAMRERAAERAAQRDYDNAKHRKNTGGA